MRLFFDKITGRVAFMICIVLGIMHGTGQAAGFKIDFSDMKKEVECFKKYMMGVIDDADCYDEVSCHVEWTEFDIADFVKSLPSICKHIEKEFDALVANHYQCTDAAKVKDMQSLLELTTRVKEWSKTHNNSSSRCGCCCCSDGGTQKLIDTIVAKTAVIIFVHNTEGIIDWLYELECKIDDIGNEIGACDDEIYTLLGRIEEQMLTINAYLMRFIDSMCACNEDVCDLLCAQDAQCAESINGLYDYIEEVRIELIGKIDQLGMRIQQCLCALHNKTDELSNTIDCFLEQWGETICCLKEKLMDIGDLLAYNTEKLCNLDEKVNYIAGEVYGFWDQTTSHIESIAQAIEELHIDVVEGNAILCSKIDDLDSECCCSPDQDMVRSEKITRGLLNDLYDDTQQTVTTLGTVNLTLTAPEDLDTDGKINASDITVIEWLKSIYKKLNG